MVYTLNMVSLLISMIFKKIFKKDEKKIYIFFQILCFTSAFETQKEVNKSDIIG